jgi:hypothetical protein
MNTTLWKVDLFPAPGEKHLLWWICSKELLQTLVVFRTLDEG